MKNKSNKKKRAVVGVCAALGCLAIAGVGYGAWVIATDISSVDSNVDVVIEEVLDERIEVSLTTAPSKSYYFSPNGSGTVIKASSNSQDENLSVSFTITIKIDPTNANTYAFGVGDMTALKDTSDVGSDAWTTSADASTELSACTTPNYISVPAATSTLFIVNYEDGVESGYTDPITSGAGFQVTAGESEENTGTYTATITATVAWGSYFYGYNPANYGVDGYEDLTNVGLDNIVKALETMQSNLDGLRFVYTFTGSVQTQG